MLSIPPPAAPTPPPARARLDPHALPPATTGRFLLLIATAVAGSVQIYAWLVERLDNVSGAPGRCATTAQAVVGRLLPSQLIDWYGECTAWAKLQEAVAIIAVIIVALVVVTVGIYLRMPIRAARGLVPLHQVVHDKGIGAVARLVDQISAKHASRSDITYYIDFASGHGTNRAFGRWHRYAVVLSLDLFSRAAMQPDSPELRRVLLHELAHIRNRDITVTYLTIASWWGFLVAVALPFTAVALLAPDTLVDFSWRIAVLLALLWVVRASVLRSREYYADARSTTTSKDEDALADTLVRHDRVRTGQSVRQRLNHLIYRAYHPDTAQRIDVVRSGERLFRLSPPVAAATGGLIGLGYPPARFLASLLFTTGTVAPGWLCGLVFGLLTAAVLGGSVWRAALWVAADERRTVHTLPSAAAFTGALVVGLLATPQPGDSLSWTTVVRVAPWVAGALALVLLLVVQLYLRWTLFCARCWLPIAGNPRRAYRWGVAQSAFVIGAWLAVWFEVLDNLTVGADWTRFGLMLAVTTFNPVTIMSLAWASVFPLATWQTQRMRASAGRYRWWRAPALEPQALPGTRTPLEAVYVTATAIIVLYGIGMLPLYPRLGHELETVILAVNPRPGAFVPGMLLLLLPAFLATTAGLLVHGLVVGGRKRTAPAATSAGAALLFVSIGLYLLMLVHITSATPLTHDLSTLLSVLSGIGTPTAPTSQYADLVQMRTDPPAGAALGLMVLGLLAAFYLVGLPAAVLGSLLRGAKRAKRTGRHPGRAPWLATVLIVPLLAAGAGLGALSWVEWRVSTQVRIPDSVDRAAVEEIMVHPHPQQIPLRDACVALVQRAAALTPTSASTSAGLDLLLAHAAVDALSSTDPVLQAIGEGTAEDLRAQHLNRATESFGTALQYCSAAVTRW